MSNLRWDDPNLWAEYDTPGYCVSDDELATEIAHAGGLEVVEAVINRQPPAFDDLDLRYERALLGAGICDVCKGAGCGYCNRTGRFPVCWTCGLPFTGGGITTCADCKAKRGEVAP